MPARRDLVDALGAWAHRESTQLAGVEVAVVGDPCGSHPVGGRHEERGEIHDAGDLTVGRDPVELLVIRLRGVERAAHRDHAVPGAIRLEVVGIGVGDGIRLHEMR